MAILGLHYTLHNSDFFIIVATYISIIRCIADFHVLVGRIAMSLSRISTFRLQSLKNCSIVLFMLFNFFQPIVHPLSFSIKSFGRDVNNILYEGDAEPSPYGVIELGTITGAAMFHTSRATYAEPLHLWDSAKLANFTTNFSFVIDTYNKTVFADGLVFFIAPVHYPIPPNSAGPHFGININTISSVVSASWDARGNSGKMAHVQITYSATTKNLTVVWTYEKNTNVAISSLSYRIDLRKVLPEWVTIGFSTANGFSGERNAIYTWDFSSSSDEISTKKKERRLFLIGAVAVFVFILIVGVAICWLVVKKRINRIDGQGNYFNSAASTDLGRQALPRRFAYKELVAATNGFANDRRLGQGGSGQVYKGIIQDLGCTVAVKRIFPESEHYESVFINENFTHRFFGGFGSCTLPEICSAADERLDMNYVPNEVECLLNVGLWCTRPNDKERPKAGQVMKVLQLEAPLPKLPHDMHDYPQPQPQPQQQTGSSQLSLTSSFETVGH
ncbi:hypothetical protein ACE6H2_004008 [Prunus campanulata]